MADLYQMVRDSGLFDSAWYRTHSTATRLFPNPIVHYALIGWKAGLNPSPRFDTQFYWNSYRDVRALGANPLVHYLLHGKKEGRLATITGKDVRTAHLPQAAPLPLFEAPPANRQRLSVVVDDNTPQAVGLGLTPVIALATALAHRHGWMLRVIIRSDTITRADIAHAQPPGSPTPHTDVVVRSPGRCADVECVAGEIWWATSQTAYRSLADYVPTEFLWWVVSANETDRHPAGEMRLLTTRLLASTTVRSIVLDESLATRMNPQGPTTVIDALPALHHLTPTPTTPPTLGVLVDSSSADNLFSSNLGLIEEALATAVIDPERWQIALIGSVTQPVTLTGSVVPTRVTPQSASDWVHAVTPCSVLVSIGAGTEPAYLARAAAAAGITTVVADSAHPVGDHLMDQLAQALATPLAAAPPQGKSLAEVAAQLDGLWGEGE
jgi:hypothetical protein